jgi:hypothetical protein
VTADPPPPEKEFVGWSGDTQILANPSEATTTATMTSMDVTINKPSALPAFGNRSVIAQALAKAPNDKPRMKANIQLLP